MQQLPACRGRHAAPLRKYLQICSLLFIFSLFGGLLAACGGSSTPAADKITLNVLVSAQPTGFQPVGGLTGLAWWQTVVKHFEAANPNITVKLNYQPTLATANTFAQTAIQTGTPLDVAAVQEGTTTTLMAKNGLAPLDSYLNSDPNLHAQDLNAPLVQEATQGGHLYGIPFNTQIVMRQYNKDLFAKAGVQPPQSYKDLLPVCQALQKAGVAHPLYEDIGGYPALADWKAWGAFPLSDDGQQATIYPKMMAWATFYHDLRWKYQCTDTRFDQGGSGLDPNISYNNGQMAWHTDSAYGVSYAKNSPQIQNVSGYVAPEAGPAGSYITTGGSHLVIPAPSKNKDAAWKFISFYMTDKVDQKAIILQLHDLPVMRSLVNDPDVIKQVPNAIPWLQALGGSSLVGAPNVRWYSEISYGPLHTQLLSMLRDPNPDHIAGYLQKAQADSAALIAHDKQLG